MGEAAKSTGTTGRTASAVRPSIEPRRGSPEKDDAPDELEVGDAADASTLGGERPSDWGSLLADLSRGNEKGPQLRLHDRTHLEFSVNYELGAAADSPQDAHWNWEAYFFAPESLRLDSQTYGKEDVYEDLQSYVRFAVPHASFAALAGEPLDRVERALKQGDEKSAIRDMRLFACEVRAAGVGAKRAVTDHLDAGDPFQGHRQARTMIDEAKQIGARTRAVLGNAEGRHDPLRTALAWTHEDVSRLLETLLGNLVLDLERANAPSDLIASARDAAVHEAREREKAGLDGVGRIGMPQRDVEHLEFRRHVLKRFTSSVLWLKAEVRPASEWVLHVLYAVAAGVAMTFAVAAALWNGAEVGSNVMSWAIVVVVAYAAKDRIKAFLQNLFLSVVSRHFPDRSWRIRGREHGVELGAMKEQSGFVAFSRLPPDVLGVRRSTRRHALEEEARPETVLFHKKEVRVKTARVREVDPRFDAVTEILRLDLRRWLVHTDDPKREFVFADPDRGVIGSAVAPRVYNISVIYRLRRPDEPNTPWRRARVVVSRKGIRRIDPIA